MTRRTLLEYGAIEGKQKGGKTAITDTTKKSLGSIVAALESLFQQFNLKYFAGELEMPVIAVSPDTTSGAYGWCTTWKAWKSKDDESKDGGFYEINMCAEHLTRPFEEVCGTLLHEMVHLDNIGKGIKDTSRGGTYHNKRFKETAEQHGLIIDRDSKYGWTITKLNDDAKAFVSTLDGSAFQLFREKAPRLSKAGSSSSRKYVCPCCGLIVRATKEVRVICGECGVELEWEG